MEEKQLLAKLKQGDTEAFETLVRQYQQKVYNLTLRLTGNPEDAWDLSQEVFFKVWRSIDTFQGQSALSTWIYRMTYNLCIDFLRAQKRQKTVSLTVEDDKEEAVELQLPDPDPDPEQALLLAEDRALLDRALRELDTEARTILTLRVVQELPYDQIAQVLHVKEGTVKSRLSRARERLRKKLAELGNQSPDRSSGKTGKEDALWSVKTL